MLRYDALTKQKAVELYFNGMPAAKIAELIGANEATIRVWLKNLNIKLKNAAAYCQKYDENIINNIKNLYNSGFNTPEIDKMLGIKRGISSYLLRKIGFPMQHRGPKSKIGKEEYFDVIDSEEKAYYLGWIMADGNVSIKSKQYCLKFHIAIQDKEIIDKFLLAINSTNKTKEKTGTNPSYYVSLTSIHMCKRLIDLGVIPKKSGNEVFPTQLPVNLYRHFIRGVFDGDGITGITTNRSGFVGSINMLENILNILGEDESLKILKTKSEGVFYFQGGKRFSRKLYKFMYEDASIWLHRKKERMEMICFE